MKIHWASWDRLCDAKWEGGMGFRDMHDFNLAMLAKQGWRLMQNPSTLVARVLKAKYYPQCDFMHAQESKGCSAMWKSIVAGKRVLDKGVRFQIANGRSVQIWRDPWLPRQHTFRPVSFPREGWSERKVGDLIDPTDMCWDENTIRGPFCEADVSLILRLPLGRSRGDDHYIWHFEKNGRYSVRSGYWCLRAAKGEHMRASSSSNTPSGGLSKYWKLIWGLAIPPKIRAFSWRLLSGFLPTRCSLASKHVGIGDVSCPLCGAAKEEPDHLFRRCKRLREVWDILGLNGSWRDGALGAWLPWILDTIDILGCREVELLLASMWAVWTARNKFIHEGSRFDSYGVSLGVSAMLHGYKEVCKYTRVGRQRPHVKWECPLRGRIKINFDGAFDVMTGSGSVGGIARNENGVGVAAVARTFKHAMSALCMEAEACRIGLQLGRDQGWEDIDIESDSAILVKALHSKEVDMSEIGQLIADCQALISDFRSVTVRHIFRKANNVAHRLAQFATYRMVDSIWLDEMPVIIRDVLYEDNCNVNASHQGASSVTSLPSCNLSVDANNNIRVQAPA